MPVEKMNWSFLPHATCIRMGVKMSTIDFKTNQSDGVGGPPPEGDMIQLNLEEASVRAPDRSAVERELKLIRASPFFHASKRSQQFLCYVVQYRLDGNQEPLKERTIGADLFKRPSNYATGDDSVVRVQAGEVRRRLEQYYQSPPVDSLVRIELPLGSYVPEFRYASIASSAPPQGPAVGPGPEPSATQVEKTGFLVSRSRKRVVWVVGIAAGLTLAVLAGVLIREARTTKSLLAQFWSPIFNTPSPVLICLAKPITYQPSIALFKRHEKFPGEFDSVVPRMNGRPHLEPNEKMEWGDMIENYEHGLGKGDVKAAFHLASTLAKLGKGSDLKIGNDYTWDDLRGSPSIIIGAFSNQRTMKITSGLHFAFVESHNTFGIQELTPPGRFWNVEHEPRTGEVVEDYGLVTRLVNSTTGQFVVVVAGITASGSEAAGAVASSNELLTNALRNAPHDWARKNLQIVVKTSVTDAVAGPPQIIAIYIW